MAFVNQFEFAPAQWLPLQDREMLDRVCAMDIAADLAQCQHHPEFEAKVVYDVHNYFVTDLFHRIRMSGLQQEKLVVLLPSPENAVFLSLAQVLNKYQVSASHVHAFFLNEYANEKGDVAPWQSPYSRSGHFMRYFYEKLDAQLRMPMDQIHFWTKENTECYSHLLAEAGGADVAYTSLSWGGGIGAIDPETFPAETMEQFMAMGSRWVQPMAETLAQDSLRGMFGCSGDIGNVPPCAVTVGPKDLAAAKERVGVEYLVSCGGIVAHQKTALKLSLFGPVSPQNPGAMLRTLPGTWYIAEAVANAGAYRRDNIWLEEKLEEIRGKEAQV